MKERYYCITDPTHTGFNACAVAHAVVEIDEQGNWLEDIDTIEYHHDDDTVRCNECDTRAKWGVPPSALEQLAKAAED